MSSEVEVRHTTVGEIDIAYHTLGVPGDPPVLLVSGLSGQLISWDEGFCQELVDRGLFVVRFDNRDVGLSTHLDTGPSGADAVSMLGTGAAPPYTLADMAADTAGLIESLGFDSVHVVGVSLGGMIGQLLAIRHPDQVRSLTSIMSTTGSGEVGQPTEAALALLLSSPPATREEVLDRAVVGNRTLGSPAYPADESETRERAARAYDRAYDPPGVARQLAAALTTPDRSEDLRRLDLPTLVIHGADDPLIAVDGGRATAAAIPGAELLIIDGMGHELPRPVWPTVAERIADLVRRAEQQRPT